MVVVLAQKFYPRYPIKYNHKQNIINLEKKYTLDSQLFLT